MYKQRGEWASAHLLESQFETVEPQERFETNQLGRKPEWCPDLQGFAGRPPSVRLRGRSGEGIGAWNATDDSAEDSENRLHEEGQSVAGTAATGRLFDTLAEPIGSTLPVAAAESSARDAARTTHARRRVVRGAAIHTTARSRGENTTYDLRPGASGSRDPAGRARLGRGSAGSGSHRQQ